LSCKQKIQSYQKVFFEDFKGCESNKNCCMTMIDLGLTNFATGLQAPFVPVRIGDDCKRQRKFICELQNFTEPRSQANEISASLLSLLCIFSLFNFF